jgi:hypothetical protein
MAECFGDVPVSQEPAVQQLKRILVDFLESGSKCSSIGFSRWTHRTLTVLSRRN